MIETLLYGLELIAMTIAVIWLLTNDQVGKMAGRRGLLAMRGIDAPGMTTSPEDSRAASRNGSREVRPGRRRTAPSRQMPTQLRPRRFETDSK